MGTSKVRTLLLACVMIMLCAAMIVGGTYALWTKDVAVTNHLVAGKLNVKLERTALTKTYLNSQGVLVTEQGGYADLSGTTPPVNVFGFTDYGTDDQEKLVPGCVYEARLKLTNNGDVEITYDIIIQLCSDSTDLDRQLKVYINNEDRGYLSAFANDGTAVISTQDLEKQADAEFIVKIVFVDDADASDLDNDLAQGQKASFDLLVKAKQKTNAS